MRKIPSWVPGTGFKQLALKWGSELRDVAEKPYAFVKHQRAAGNSQTSFLSRLIEAGEASPAEEHNNKWSAMSLYVAGADTVSALILLGVSFGLQALKDSPHLPTITLHITIDLVCRTLTFFLKTVAALSTFFLAMLVSPDAQRKAQEEIDQLTGGLRLPVASDRSSLPFIDAMVKETLRWGPVGPMILPHSSTEDDIWNGHLIPKDAIIIANVWSVQIHCANFLLLHLVIFAALLLQRWKNSPLFHYSFIWTVLSQLDTKIRDS